MKRLSLKPVLLITVFGLGIILLLLINPCMLRSTESRISTSLKYHQKADAAILPGAGVYGKHRVSAIAYDRIVKSVELYRAGKVKKILITGDHGTRYYDEVNAIRRWCIKYGVPARDIFMDHAGFSTYESIYRAKNIFRVKNAIIVTQRYHLSRALYLADRMGIHATGYPADRRGYLNIKKYSAREYLARIKDFFYINLLRPKPKFLGKEIPISGDGRQTGG